MVLKDLFAQNKRYSIIYILSKIIQLAYVRHYLMTLKYDIGNFVN